MKIKASKKQKVFVGLSGGVDSSVSAAILQQATPNNFSKLFGRPTPQGFRGFDVTGVFIKTWQPEFIECTWRDDRRDAMRVAAHLGIPFVTLDLEKEYKEGVADYMISEYKKGRTPNPDVMCNREVKFGAFWKWAEKNGADFIATGHYAQILEKENTFSQNLIKLKIKNYKLKIGADPAKDQSYFLWTLTQEDLAHVLFPIGHLKKENVRKLAKKFDLPTADKKDSQGICMLGPLDLKGFLKHYIKPKKGNVINEIGEVIGHHEGSEFLTLGERHGFTIIEKSPTDSPYYIVSKDVKKNTITVSHLDSKKLSSSYTNILPARPQPDEVILAGNDFGHLDRQNTGIVEIEKMNWITEIPEVGRKYIAQLRYHGKYLPCKVKEIKKDLAILEIKNYEPVSPGQSIVIYNSDVCMGGGIVS